MASESVQVLLLTFLIYLISYSSQEVLQKSTITVGKRSFKLTKRTWVYKDTKNTYQINLLDSVKNCDKAKVCRGTTSLGKTYSSSLASDGSGFTLNFTDAVCETSNNKLTTLIQFKCGKYMGSPVLLDEFSTSSSCVKIFEFITNEACKTPPTISEVPCYLYNGTKRIDLTPLIKTKGGYEVASDVKGHNFFINVCRDITPDNSTANCPSGGGCRTGSTPISIGSLTTNSIPHLSTDKTAIIISYKTTKKLADCQDGAATNITFVCPQTLGGKEPIMTSTDKCTYEVLWETEYACSQNDQMSNNSCVLSNNFVQFDLRPLQKPDGHNYRVQAAKYTYYINVCKSTSIPNCAPSGYSASVCQEIADTNQVYSLGVYNQQKLSYIDGQLVLRYKGGKTCGNGFKRESFIMFKCNPTIGQGAPVFAGELSHCVYFFEWETKYACPPSRRTGSACRATRNGTNYDLTELIRSNGTGWLVIDGENSNSTKMIYINVCGQLSRQAATAKCNINSAACLIDKKDGSVKDLGRYLTAPVLNPDNSLTLNYTGGGQCIKGVMRTTVVTFVCSHGDLTSPPVLVSHSVDDCIYTIMWKTAVACPLGLNQGDNCKVEDKSAGYIFDLNAMQGFVLGHNYTEIQYDKYTYYLRICKNITDSTIKDCANAGACQAQGKTYHKMGVANTKLFYYDGILKLMYNNGEACHNGQKRQTHIAFICSPHAPFQGTGRPKFVHEDHCIYHFRWPTKFACPAQVVECAARYKNLQYDLSSLAKTDDNWSYQNDKGTYYINVCRTLNLNSAVRQCFGTSAVCLKASNGDYVNLGQVDSSLKATSQGTVSITYTNGDRCQADNNKRYQSKIIFICKKGVVGQGPHLESTGDNGCLYNFRWESAAACAITNTIGANCSVQDPKSATIFNMFSLRRQPSKPYTITTPSGRTFTLNICAKIDKTLCNKDSNVDIGVCMKETDKKLLNLGVVSQKLEFEGETLVLTYRDGDRDIQNGFPRISKIRFYCDPKTPLGSPKYIEQASEKDGEVFYFDFKTSLACSINQVQCQLKTPSNQSYDLTPLGLIAGNWEAVDTRSSHKHLHYYINVCRAINTIGSSIQCPFTTVGAVQIDHSTSKCYNLGYIQSNPKVSSDGLVTLHYYGGTTCHNKYPRSTRINLQCAKFTGPPIFEMETSECEYVFNWQTPSACALTREAGDNCQVTDRQYDYKYNLSSLSGLSFSFKAQGGTVYLGICSKASPCKDTNTAACLIKDNKEIVKLGDVTKQLTYFRQEISLRYSNSKCSLLVRFECDPNVHGKGDGPKLESVNDKKCEYYARWTTDLACRPNTHVQCSIRKESSDKKTDLQYDFTRLTKHNDNWKATSSSASFYINVCRPVARTGEASNCPPTAGVCKVETEKSGTKRATSLGQLTSVPVVKGNNIYLNYSRGDKCSKSGKFFSTIIRMECGANAEAAPMEVNMYKDTCTYEFLWITKYACAINTVNQTITNDCTAVNPITNYKFDLNRLKNDTDNYRVDDKNGHYFLLNVCQGLKKATTKCGKDSGSCQFTLDGSTIYNAGKASQQLTYQDGVLQLTYAGGQLCHHSKTLRTTVISFVCNWTSSNDFGKPVFVGESDDCTYYFSWHTKLACERTVECSPVIQNKNSNTKYGLRKLAKDDHNWLVLPSDGAVHTSTYYINICKALVPMKGIKCPAGASACEQTTSGTFLSLGYSAGPPKVDGNKIIVTYVNGTNNAQTRIELTCNHGSLGKPVFAYKDKNLYTFTWATSAACVNQEVVDLPRCRVYDNGTGFYYDVSSLRTANNGYITLASPDGGTVYASVCRSLTVKTCSGAGVCLARSGNNQALGLYQYMTMTYIYEENMLMIKYCDQKCDSDPVKYTSRIMFICDETMISSNKGYSLESIDDHGANIIWRTSLVCPPAQEQCVFNDQGHLYDLQLLSSKMKSWHYTTSTGDKYWFNLCRGINDQTGCPRSATVCAQLGSNKNILVLGYGKTQTMTKSTPTDKQILVHYTGESNIPVCTKSTVKAHVMFQMICGQHVGKPSLYHVDALSCTFTFRWTTVAACQLQNREPVPMSNCLVHHPLTGQTVDFHKLDNGPITVDTFSFRICDPLPANYLQTSCANKWVCSNGIGYDSSPKLYYEDNTFELWFTTTNSQCAQSPKNKETFIINFQCDESIRDAGKPIFEYESTNCHHVYTWSTSVVCIKDQSGVIIDRFPKPRSSGSSAGKKAGIAFAVIAVLLVVAAAVFVLHNRQRRQSLVFFVRENVRKVRKKNTSGSNAVYKYQKITVEDEDDVDLLLGFSDDEEDDGHETRNGGDDERQTEGEDEEMITL